MDETRKLVISIVVAILVVVGLGVLLYFGARSHKELKDEITTKEQQVAALDQKISRIEKLEKEKEMLAAGQQLAKEVLPDGEEVERLDQILTLLEQQAEVDVVDLRSRKPVVRAPTPRAKAAKLPYERYAYTLKGRGTFFAFAKFASLLESYKRFIQVDAFDIRMKPEEFPISEFTMDISTFSYRMVPAPAAPAQTGAKP